MLRICATYFLAVIACAGVLITNAGAQSETLTPPDSLGAWITLSNRCDCCMEPARQCCSSSLTQ